MKSIKSGKRLHTTELLRRLLVALLCFNIVLTSFCASLMFTVQATDSDSQQEGTREDVKARLLSQIKDEGWDPYSSDMSIEEFYALMELFDEGKISPESENTKNSQAYASAYKALRMVKSTTDEPDINKLAMDEPVSINDDAYIPRTKFLFAGLSKYDERRKGEEDSDFPEEYNNNLDYEPTGELVDGEPKYYYPHGLDPYGVGYMRPPTRSWDGIKIADKGTKRVVLVSEDANSDNSAVAGNVIQGLFAQYTGYYVKQVTVDGANINVLGMIELEDRFVYYYLSAEGQNTQVSTTTLPDEAKFIIDYVPNEHEIEYKVRLDNQDVTHDTPTGVVFYGSDTPTTANWVESIFGAGRAHRTTDGAYSFDVLVPYGYQLQILISINMTVDIPYETIKPNKESFFVEIDHTSKKDAVHEAWLKAYYTYLKSEGFVNSEAEFNSYIKETKDESTGNITLTWNKPNDPDTPAHNAVLTRMAERINDFILHNNGYALGTYPQYTVRGPGGFRLLPDEKVGPTEHTMNDTFYNHLVKADRTITAVLTKQANPTFDVSQILQKSDGARDRGASATESFALQSIEPYDENRDYYDADYDYHNEIAGTDYKRSDEILSHSADYPNINNIGGWSWNNSAESFFKSQARNMIENEDGTYYYSYLFQTNSSENYYLDVLEVNGISVQIPYYPKYNWRNSYKINGNEEIADDAHPYYTEVRLADGATCRLEFLLGWNPGGHMQRHYRITVTGARSNVVITGLNLMQYAGGAPEFVTYNLTGVYSDQNGESQTAPAIEYYDKKAGWTRKAQSNVIVYNSDATDQFHGIDLVNGDTGSEIERYGANIRFKIADGYGNPYYIWANRHGDAIFNQTSVAADGTTNPIISLRAAGRLMPGEPGALENNKLSSQYIYDGGDGYYYIRVTSHNKNGGAQVKDFKIALLTVVARTVKYTVRYMPEYDPQDGREPWYGFTVNDETGEMTALTEGIEVDLKSMPTFDHDPNICSLWEMAKDDTGEVPKMYQDILHQYDDNGGPFYDLIFNTMATIASNSFGTIRPRDASKQYTFANWVVVGEDFTPVTDGDGKPVQFLSGAIDFTQYADYAVKHTAFGNDDTDIHVLRLMPVWNPINNPFTYNVVLNWVDAVGDIHMENFSSYWDEVVTEMTVGGKVYVYLNKDAEPLLSWIANHPTYTFWDDVNNATDDTEIEKALTNYLEGGKEHKNYEEILSDLLQTDEFIEGTNEHPFGRMGGDIFVVNADGCTISVWMYEDRGGMVFSKEVQQDPFATDDEYYFTISNAMVGEDYATPLKGVYKAYPQFVYDEDGLPRERVDDDAWLVEFENGKIVSIDGNKSVTYFTLKPGDGIALYVSAGQYTVTELGSKSGRAYKARVTYTASNGSVVPDSSWNIPDDESKLWLQGDKTEYVDPQEWGNEISQVSATVNFQIGEKEVVQTLTFWNQTVSLVIQNELIAPKGHELWNKNFKYSVQLILPDGETPLTDDQENYYYDMLVYKKSGKEFVPKENRKLVMEEGELDSTASTLSLWSRIVRLFTGTDNVWHSAAKFDLKPDEYAVIVMPVPTDIEATIDYKAIETSPLVADIWHLQGEQYVREGELSAGVQGKEVYTNVLNESGIIVTNRVIRSDGKKDTSRFSFTLTLSGKYTDESSGAELDASALNGTYGDVTFKNGVVTFSLRDGESMTIMGLPAGITYSVVQAQKANYTMSSTNGAGTLIANTTSQASFVNEMIIPTEPPTEPPTTPPTEPPTTPPTEPVTGGYIAITESGGDSNETFLYLITKVDTGEKMIVSVSGGGSTLVYCPFGEYTVTEMSDWAWRYNDGVPKQKMPITVTSDNTKTNPAHADFENERNTKVWLGGENRGNKSFSSISSYMNKYGHRII